MNLGRITLVGACLLLFSGGSPDLSSSLPMVADGPYHTPTLETLIPYADPSSPLGEGSFDLSAQPEANEIRVHLMVGATQPGRRWERCSSLRLEIDGSAEPVPARYAGIPMNSGVYDAVTAEITIVHVRAMAAAHEVTAELCGSRVELPDGSSPRLREFVRRFDELGQYDGPPPPRRKDHGPLDLEPPIGAAPIAT